MSLRTRLVLAFAGLALLVSLVLGVVVYEFSARNQVRRERDTAAEQATEAAAAFAQSQRLPFGATLDAATLPGPLRAAARRGTTATWVSSGRVFGAARVPGSSEIVSVETSRASDRATLASLRRTLIGAGLVATIVGAISGTLLASRLSARLRKAADVARRIGVGEQTRVGETGGDEVAALGRALDGMADALTARIDREARVSADVAHELRTPVAGLVAAAGLLGDDEPSLLVRGRASRLARLVEDLLEVTRLERGAETTDLRTIDLGRLARELADEHGRSVTVVGGASVVTDPRHLARILSNLIENAHRHGRPPVVVRLLADRVTVEDDGPGFSDEMLERALQPFASGDPGRGGGAGLGLTIAEAHARLIGGQIVVANRSEGGAVVALQLDTNPTRLRHAADTSSS